jgi:site-specific DNA-methyltransferase (cytosine-N4-specific)
MVLDAILQGNVVEVLRTIPDESVDCVITSPPYWGLRHYGEAANTVWGGQRDCEHEWVLDENKVKLQYGVRMESTTCKRCGAWYGQLGLEPTLRLYLEHLLLVTAEVKRVLKPTGTVFWNHGDSYGGSGNGSWNAPIEVRGKQYRKCLNIDQEYLGPPRKDPDTKAKCLVAQNWRLALRMVDEQGWILRNACVWYRPNHMPESVKDRFTKTYEMVFFFVKKAEGYYFNLDAVRVPSRWANLCWSRKGASKNTPYEQNNPRVKWGLTVKEARTVYPEAMQNMFGSPRARVWRTKTEEVAEREGYDPEGLCPVCGRSWKRHASPDACDRKEGIRRDFMACSMKGKNPGDMFQIATKPAPKEALGKHFAAYPEELIRPFILAGCPEGGVVLDPFAGSGTTCVVAKKLGRHYIGVEINPEYCEIARRRVAKIENDLLALEGSFWEAIENAHSD